MWVLELYVLTLWLFKYGSVHFKRLGEKNLPPLKCTNHIYQLIHFQSKKKCIAKDFVLDLSRIKSYAIHYFLLWKCISWYMVGTFKRWKIFPAQPLKTYWPIFEESQSQHIKFYYPHLFSKYNSTSFPKFILLAIMKIINMFCQNIFTTISFTT